MVRAVCLTIIMLVGFIGPTKAQENWPSQLTFTYRRSENNPLTQWFILVYSEALHRMSIDLKTRKMSSKRSMLYLNENKVDGEFGRLYGYNSLFPNLVRVEEANFRVRLSAFTVLPDIEIHSWDDLRNTNYRIDYLRGGKKINEKLSLVTRSEQLSQADSLQKAFKKLILGRTDIVITAESHAMSYLNSQAFKDFSQQFGKPDKIWRVTALQESTSHLWLSAMHQNLAPQLAARLKEMKAEGLFDTYREQVGLLPSDLIW